MSDFENKLLKQIINKLGCNDEPGLLEKSTELIRLLDLKSSKTVSLIGDYGKIVICIDLAASQLGIVIDMSIAYKLSGLRKSQYVNNKRIIEKLLDLSMPLGIKEICTQLNLNEMIPKAMQLFDIYKMKMTVAHDGNDAATAAADDNDEDLRHPQYSAMAIYQACKLNNNQKKNEKFYKTKLRQFSYLKSIQWNKLEQQWDKILMENHRNANKLNTRNQNKNDVADDDDVAMADGTEKQNKDNDNGGSGDGGDDDEIEDYETWKRRMLFFAKLQLGIADDTMT